MLKKILRGLFTIIGLILGYLVGRSAADSDYFSKIIYLGDSPIKKILFLIVITILFGIIMFLISPWINSVIMKVMDYIEKSLQKLSATEILFGVVGALIGLLVSVVFLDLLSKIPIVGAILAVLVAILMAALGANIAIRKREEVMSLISNINISSRKLQGNKEKKNKNEHKGYPKVLDTSVIIDGRIFDICQTGFVEGPLVIPNFVLAELRHIADSSDGLKRTRGRRGLDILNKIQKELNIDVITYEKDFPDIEEVDSKLLKLSQVLDGKVVTNDYNLNKVAEFQGVPVLNINELANAVKPVVLPGEEMKVQIIKDGKESGQGIAYLDDGTMIVIEGGKKSIGETKDVVVTSVLQTAAGRMIFARQKGDI
ncbi:PIN/TRAM domain-containing protein [Clostridium luticellarii]|uniref:Putative PIN and TRAM-domain containing protein n=1 Tax=Clostridium luticellarii TaxID=1691940 RepID=A0A2T0BS24_9CLOT|nr:PIN/TRAM domain-containing protein [Clostridium luticellarii]MCI1944665.1 PIN/TRAM domain-containing protein [Clostridium luticellarii]MCI1968162.1 PIN/TRAM domain-containing protein [Clostridium luticellarii]MCI1995293.1 PIN/TRAM domain-containing protein [Clostridium luticellarii]MCI2039710.1 PIN/TRAM domain-containing protein [Clostridium luticellarii]PRR86691.1 putative PIN and TRAM-domain containing protein precursor [Clostridium luticellarii]